MKTKKHLQWIIGGLVVVLLATFPLFPIPIPGILPGATNSPGSLDLLILCLLNVGLAATYRLLLGVTGLLSFGHALFFGAGGYVFGIMLVQYEMPFWWAVLLNFGFGVILSGITGAIALRVNGIPFAMVTLAFGQAGLVLVRKNSEITGGGEGLNITKPLQEIGMAFPIRDIKYPFWIILTVVVVVFLILTLVEHSRAGHVASAIRENELRINVLGLKPYFAKWIMFVVAGTLASTIGMAYIFAMRAMLPHSISPELTISVLLMVVLGGLGSKWGAVIGAFLYTILNNRLIALSSSDFVTGLPDFLRIPLKEPLFILGVLFILVVLFMPGGIHGAYTRAVAKLGLNKQAKNEEIQAA